jgi:glyoxylase-like metal-dependent hydrolase (beta-lactamase superfamily II)
MSEQRERWVIGATRLTTIVESETSSIPVELFFPDASASDVAKATWLVPDVAGDDGAITFRVQSFVVEHNDKTIVIDPCVGNGKQRNLFFWNDLQLPWLERFTAAGFDPDSVDLVIHTHLHEDHIGWDTHLADGLWVPTFPNARHVYVAEELDWAEGDDRRQGHDPFADSIAPILDAGLSWEVTPDADIGDGIRLLPTPGHTPGHAAIRIETSAEPLVISGDVLHHPFQLSNPDIAEVADWDAGQARETRRAFFDEHADGDALVAGTHFPVAPVGHIETHGTAWKFTTQAGNALG